EIARIERIHEAHAVEIHTGNPGWDAALALSQSTALGLFTGHLGVLPHASFVINRLPDQGYSIRGDGSDYTYTWNGQTPLDAYYLNSIILPGGAGLARGVLDNFIHVQQENGFIDWKPGLSGQTSHLLAQPLLAALAHQIDPDLDDVDWLKQIYPALSKFIRYWVEQGLGPESLPHWSHPLQSGLEDGPLYNRWSETGQGVEIATLEPPALAAMLSNELSLLSRMARRLEQTDDLLYYQAQSQFVDDWLRASWNPASKAYLYQESSAHFAGHARFHKTLSRNGTNRVNKNFTVPQRLQIRVETLEQATRPVSLRLSGTRNGEAYTEQVTPLQIAWSNLRGDYTTQGLFQSLEIVEITGIKKGDRVLVSTIDYTQHDISTFLPLWAHVPTPAEAGAIIQRSLLPQFGYPPGLGHIPHKALTRQSAARIPLVWNQLLGEALLHYGFQAQAAALVEKIMTGIIAQLVTTQSFHDYIPADGSPPSGERNSLRGLAPVGLFLETLGIHRLTDRQVVIQGSNPFPWPVTVQYQGTTIVRAQDEAHVTFYNGSTISVKGDGPHRVWLP
ncbi:MAG: hypothetical protein VB089_22630, partial [Anaerolineaceae bacterium]|nr:hypothetical protein [Anaerolineaceae bacterium]